MYGRSRRTDARGSTRTGATARGWRKRPASAVAADRRRVTVEVRTVGAVRLLLRSHRHAQVGHATVVKARPGHPGAPETR